jgi:translation initiation factor IF-1
VAEEKDQVATVLELLPSAIVRVELDKTRATLLAHAGSSREVNFVRMRPGDKVLVEVSPHDPTRGRVKRLLRKP